ncbi:MAG: aminoacyl-tRNA hydrolase [Gammaproteobacteria bacterium RIFOXYA12_FULL_61_12]|nr:MAG: aminoacyl-tRNA hydrolase [Gammaproteobacteria bacterium RIFOXYD12_FULL_61_37]OGT93084.1 MAG: aminoacyl-tRNA hydrolase [Gammaproteobacteria bacterium RIFOXYA12_FULL_61_12]
MSDLIQLIVGLGNPGPKYEATRHNAGFWFLDQIARAHRGTFRAEGRFQGEVCKILIGGAECWLLKPATFMNHSGRSVSALAGYYKIKPENILVAHDELDLPAGTVRLKKGGGHGGHNGLRDIIAALGGNQFWRLRMGIDHPGNRDQVVDYVLSKPSKEDAAAIIQGAESATGYLERICAGGQEAVMNRLHG